MELTNVSATSTQLGVRHNLELKETGFHTDVGNDCRSRLMYYLSCFSGISKFLTVHPEWKRYIDYKNYSNMTVEEEEELYHICNDVITLSVAEAIGFIDVEGNDIAGSSNKFFDVTNTDEVILDQIHVHIDENSLYAARRTVGAKSEIKFEVMLYTKYWICDNYHKPLVELSSMIERHKEDKKRRLHNEKVIRENPNYCCLITKRDKSKCHNLIKFVMIIYLIQSVALLFVYLQANKPDNDGENSWYKWVNLAAFILSIINIVLGVISVILVCLSCCVENWIAYVRFIIRLMMCTSGLCVPLSLFFKTYDVVLIIQVLIAVSMTTFSCVINEGTKVRPAYLCLCCGKKSISYDKIHYYL